MKARATSRLRFYPGYFSAPRNYQRTDKRRQALTACHPTLWSWMNPTTFFEY